MSVCYGLNALWINHLQTLLYKFSGAFLLPFFGERNSWVIEQVHAQLFQWPTNHLFYHSSSAISSPTSHKWACHWLRSITIFGWLSFELAALMVVLLLAWSVAQLCPNLCDPVDWSWPGSSVPGIFQATTLELEWVAVSSSRGSSRPRGGTVSPAMQTVSCTASRVFTTEPQGGTTAGTPTA